MKRILQSWRGGGASRESSNCESLEPRVLLAAAVVSVRASDSAAAESAGRPNPGAIVIERTGGDISSALVVSYSVSGTAGQSDFQGLPGTATIAAGKKSVILPIITMNDAVAEESETVVLNLLASDAYALHANAAKRSATVMIADDEPTVAITRSKDANEGKSAPISGVFTVKRTGKDYSAPLVVEYSLMGDSTATAGEDFRALSGSVTIAAGKTSATITIDPVVDTVPEATETVHLALSTLTTYRLDARKASATVGLIDVRRVEPLTALGMDQNRTWSYALTSDLTAAGQHEHVTADGKASLVANENTFVWSIAATNIVGSSDNSLILPTATFERRSDGVYLTNLYSSVGPANDTEAWTISGLRLAPPTLMTTASGNGQTTVSTPYGDFNGTVSSKVALGATQSVTVPAGTFQATLVTLTLSLRASGRVTLFGETTNVVITETATIAFLTVPGIGPVKFTDTVTGKVSARGQSVSFKAISVAEMTPG